MYLRVKREREEGMDIRIMNLAASYLTSILATRTDNNFNLHPKTTTRVFECKTCNRQFPSFQALGGHRASHKKSKTTESSNNNKSSVWAWDQQPRPISKPKAHECAVCGLEFPMGQALGGHMRKHRAVASCETKTDPTLSLSSLSRSPAPIVKTGRILCLDLNLAPPGNNGLDFQLEKVFPLFH